MNLKTRHNSQHHASLNYKGFTLTELLVVIVLIAMFVAMAQISLFGILRKNTVKAQLQEFVSTMQMAASAAAESDRKYEVVINLDEQYYILRQITNPDLLEVLEEEIIIENEFSENCQVVYVIFDDLVETNEDFQEARFRAGNAGWQHGGKILFVDNDDKEYSVVINRLNRIVVLKDGDVDMLMPRESDEIPF